MLRKLAVRAAELFTAALMVAMILWGVYGITLLAAPTPPQEVPEAPRQLYEGVLPTGQPVILVVDCERLFDSAQALAVALGGIAADSSGAACVHPSLAAKALRSTEIPVEGEEAP